MKITKAQAIKLGHELQKLGWGVFDEEIEGRICCGEERDEDEKFCPYCGKKLVTKLITDDETVNEIMKAVSQI